MHGLPSVSAACLDLQYSFLIISDSKMVVMRRFDPSELQVLLKSGSTALKLPPLSLLG
jgi:hypothetical protein